MNVVDFISKYLHVQGVTHIFELSGGMITQIIDSIYREGNINIVSVKHEQAAAFAAEGYARETNIPGIALATSGPGATNLLTGIGSCFFDSVPAIFITGQVNTHELKGDKKIRQLGFQETDVVSMAEPICKKVYQLKKGNEIVWVLKEAFELALSGRMGPVLIDIPMNVQREFAIEEYAFERIVPQKKEIKLPDNFWLEFNQNLQKSERPIILIGRGVINDKSLFRRWAEQINIPVVTSLLAVDAMESNHHLKVGMIGSYGNRWANIAIGNADFLVVIGSRLDIKQTGADVAGFSRNKIIYQVDIDESEINNRVSGVIGISTTVEDFLNQAIQNTNGKETANWLKKINEDRLAFLDTNELKEIQGMNPNVFIKKMSENSSLAKSYTADVGNHQMWAAQSLVLHGNQTFHSSGGMGAMGFSLPAAIGIALANDKPVVSISGDGGFQLNIQELQTIVHHQIPIKIVIMNNESLGMIRQFQDSYFDGRHQSTVWGYSAPDFQKIALAYGIDAMTIEKEEEIESAVQKMWLEPNKPFLLQVMIDKNTNVYPKIAFGKPITEMEPDALPIQIEST
ncbi:MAG: thiamine pyrophosphate-binding protein [bacterium]|nr:thiamine pyrophosphate-binding protein [bacterium]